MKKCVNCKKKIKEKEHHFEVIEKNKGFIVNVSYAHKNCQEEYNKMLMERQITPEMKESLYCFNRKRGGMD